MNRTVKQKRADFRSLHASGCFVLPNPWDVGTARMLAGLGFKALATTSSGFAWSQGHADGAVPREVVLAHLRTMAAATDLPLNADFESGYAADAAGVFESVRMAIDTGVAGLSIEDSTGDAANPLRSIEVSVERLRAARAAIVLAAWRKPAHAVRASAPPMLMRRTPMAATSSSVNSLAAPMSRFTGFGATAATTAVICSRVRMPGA